MELNEIKHLLRGHTGSDSIYKHRIFPKVNYTEGFRDYMIKAKAYWISDLLIEVVKPLAIRNPDTYNGVVIVDKENTCNIIISDYKETVMYSKFISWTTHPQGEMKFQVGWDGERLIACLPSEN